MKKPYVLLTAAVSALAVAGAVGVGVAAADPTSPASTPSASATPTAGSGATNQAKTKAKHGDLTRRALHGEVTLGGKLHRVVDFQRGTVTAATPDSLTVRSADGFVGTYVVGSKTKVRVAKKQAAIGDVAVGDRVRVVAVKNGHTVIASRVVDRKK